MTADTTFVEVKEIPKQRSGGGRSELAVVLRENLDKLAANPGMTARVALYSKATSASRAANRLRKARTDLHFAARFIKDGEFGVFCTSKDTPPKPGRKAAR